MLKIHKIYHLQKNHIRTLSKTLATIFPRKIGKPKSEIIKLLHAKNMWDFSLFIEQDISDKKR